MSLTHNSVIAKSEPTWGSVDKKVLPRIAFARKGDPDKKSTWGFPHHWVKDGGGENDMGVVTTGTMYLHRQGLSAAWAAAMGGRSGKKAEPAVIAHLRKHYTDIGVKPAQLQSISDQMGLKVSIRLLDYSLVEAGLAEVLELYPINALPDAELASFIVEIEE